jgi:hypothetical protein
MEIDCQACAWATVHVPEGEDRLQWSIWEENEAHVYAGKLPPRPRPAGLIVVPGEGLGGLCRRSTADYGRMPGQVLHDGADGQHWEKGLWSGQPAAVQRRNGNHRPARRGAGSLRRVNGESCGQRASCGPWEKWRGVRGSCVRGRAGQGPEGVPGQPRKGQVGDWGLDNATDLWYNGV